MHPPSRARRILKWTGVGFAVLILAIWIASLSYRIVIAASVTLRIDQGRVALIMADFGPSEIKGHSFRAAGPKWVQYEYSSQKALGKKTTAPAVSVHFWLLLLIVAIPTAWLWHRDRRRNRPGHCQHCGYDLTGNTSGVCSVCGESKPAANA